MKGRKRSLSPAQLRYFRIGPKVLDPEDIQSREQINSAIDCRIKTSFDSKYHPSLITLNRLPKPSYGNFQSTLRNFNILHNKHFGLETVEHQVQKFGERARIWTQRMISAKKFGDKATEKQKKLRQKIRQITDNRREIVAYSIKNGMKLKLKLSSFELKDVNSKNSQILPLTYLKVLVQHVNSSRLLSVIEPALKIEGNQITIQFERIVSRISDYKNKQEIYDRKQFLFDSFGKELKLTVPVLQIMSEKDRLRQVTTIDNKSILQIVNTNFENVDAILDKYFDNLDFLPMDS